MEIDDKYYENLTIVKSQDYNAIMDALEHVKKFIIHKRRILVGGMSIDYALKLKDIPGIYADDELPDFDFYSHVHFKDAYDLAGLLWKKGARDISVINARHPSTMKVRIKFRVVADITYIPKNIIEHIPTLRYKGFAIIHPHMQMIDQHRSMSYPYENTPMETILSSRPRKDMKRYDLLSQNYPLRILNIAEKSIKLKENTLDESLLDGTCVSGFYALNYWIERAQELGFKAKNNFGHTGTKYKIPIDSHGLTLYTDDIKTLYGKIVGALKPQEMRFYHRFLDKLPRKIIIDNEWELFDNKQKIAAHVAVSAASGTYHIANLQTIMLYLLTNYILLMKIKNIKRGFSFYTGYLECQNMIKWASHKYYAAGDEKTKDLLRKFLPTAESYGSLNLDESYIVSIHRFNVKNKETEESNIYRQPRHIYDSDIKDGKVPDFYYSFNYDKSEVFNFNGESCDNFIDETRPDTGAPHKHSHRR